MTRTSAFVSAAALLFVFVLLPCGAAAQTPDWREFPEIDISVSGVTLGTPYAEVLKQLGEPKAEVVDGVPRGRCLPKSAELFYPGLIVKLGGAASLSDFRVWSIEVKSDSWAVAPGIRVGESMADVRWLLGEPGFELAYGGQRNIIYATAGKTGIATLIFRGRGELQMIILTEACGKRPDGGARRSGR